MILDEEHVEPNHWFLNSAKKEVDKVDVVSFDVFDTALLRRVLRPRHVFWIVERKARLLLGEPLLDFYSLRCHAEDIEEAKYKKDAAYNVTLGSIYAVLGTLLGRVDDAVLAIIRDFELETERGVALANSSTKSVFDYALSRNKKVIFLSDMYLSAEVIRQLLLDNGYEHFDKLYVSSEFGARKRDGRLYEIVITELDSEPGAILHIGDNWRSDVWSARRKGIRTLHLPRVEDSFLKVRRNREVFEKVFAEETMGLEKSLVAALLANEYARRFGRTASSFNAFSTSCYNYGFLSFGPLLAGLVLWLSRQVVSEKIDKLFFLSRDGKVIKTAFDQVSHLTCASTSVETEYVLASRRALLVARMRDNVQHNPDICYMLYNKAVDTLNDCFLRIGMDLSGQRVDFLKVGIDIDQKLGSDEGDNIILLRRLLSYLEKPLLEAAQKERDSLVQYYRDRGLSDDGVSTIAVVDIGWQGTLFYAISDILDLPATKFSGLYLATYPQHENLEAKGYLSNAFLFKYGIPEPIYTTIKENLEIVELFFSSDEPSFSGFETIGDEVLPVFDDTEKVGGARSLFVNDVQKGAIDFVKEIQIVLEFLPELSLSSEWVADPFLKLLSNPVEEEAALFLGIQHSQHTGNGSSAGRKDIVADVSRAKLFYNPIGFVRDIRRSYWKSATLSRIGVYRYFYYFATYLYRVSEPMRAWISNRG